MTKEFFVARKQQCLQPCGKQMTHVLFASCGSNLHVHVCKTRRAMPDVTREGLTQFSRTRVASQNNELAELSRTLCSDSRVQQGKISAF